MSHRRLRRFVRAHAGARLQGDRISTGGFITAASSGNDSVGTALVRPDGLVTAANAGLERLLGYTAQELRTIPFLRLVHPKDRQRDRNFLATIATKKKARCTLELRYLSKEKDIVWGRTTVDVYGSRSRIALVQIEDITARKRMEAALGESEDKYRSLFELCPVPISLVSRDGTIIEANAAAAENMGYRRDEYIGTSALPHYVDLSDRLRFQQQVEAQGAVRDYELQLRKRNGDLIHVLLNSIVRKDADGKVLGYQSIVRDVTAQKLSEEALRKSDERFRLVTRATDDAVWDWDITKDELWYGEGFTVLFGYASGDVAKGTTTWSDHIHPEDKGRVLVGLGRAVHENKKSWSDEYRFRRADGSFAYVLDRAHTIFDEAGQPVRLIGAMTDISKKRELEQRLSQAQKMVAVGRLASGVAHDANNILVGISIYAGMLQTMPELSETARGYIGEILKATGHGGAMTRQLLAFSRGQARTPKVFDLNLLLGNLRDMLQRLVGEDVRLWLEPSSERPSVHADPAQVEQVLINLAVNARDAMPNGGRLVVTTGIVQVRDAADRPAGELSPGEYVVLTVSDGGVGMDPETLDRVFEPFFTTKTLGKGTGLGLATVYGIVKQNNGHIEVESEPGKGTRVRIYLPRVRQSVETPLAGKRAPAKPKRPATILFIEDEDVVRNSISEYLKSRGHTVLAASSARYALEAARQVSGAIDVLVSDVVLPDASGPELCQQVCRLHPEAKVLYISGYTGERLAQTSESPAIWGFLHKPFTITELESKLSEVLQEA